MTRLEQLQNAIYPLISEHLREESTIRDIVVDKLCPVGKPPCLMGTPEKCLKCWNREVSVE